MYSQLGLLGLGDSILAIVIVAVISYLIGNISPSILQGRAKGVDIRKEGSGNAGTTNTLRVLGKKAAALTLVVDILKGTFCVVLSGLLIGQEASLFAAVAVFLGHVWPVLFGFRGGKGVATAFGAIIATNPIVGLGCLGVVVIVVLLSRIVSLGSMCGAVACPVLAFFLQKDFFPMAVVIAAVVLIKHRTNILRLAKGEESKLSFKGKK